MKINVAWTVAGTVRFVLTRLLSIVRIGWLPAALAVLVSDVMSDLHNWAGSHDAPAVNVFSLGTYFGAQLLASVVATLGYLRLSFGREVEGHAFGYFQFGRPESLYFGACVLLVLCLAPVAIGLVALVASDIGSDVLIVIALLLAAVSSWIWLRLTLQPAVILLEGKLGFARSWRLSRGNALRFLVALLIGSAALWAADLGLYHAVAGTWPYVDPQAPLATFEALLHWQSETASLHRVQTLGVDLAIRILQYAVVAGVIAASYRQLAAEPK